jgi:hypothetical protein
MQDAKVIKNMPKSYLAAIKNSTGSQTWRNFYANIDDIEQDVLRDGELSCAYFVSSILAMFGVIDHLHATVQVTVEKLPEYNWQKVDKPQPGDLLVWREIEVGGTPHQHIGFYIGNEKAISNSSKQRIPVEHDWLFRNDKPRQINSIWRNQSIR